MYTEEEYNILPDTITHIQHSNASLKHICSRIICTDAMFSTRNIKRLERNHQNKTQVKLQTKKLFKYKF